MFKISEIAAMSGLSAHTIRAWERRYQVVSPHRTLSNQRRYAIEDLDALVRLKQAVVGRGLSLRLAALEQDGGPLDGPGAAALAPARGRTYEPDDWRAAADVLPQLVLVVDGWGLIVDANIAVARAAGIVRGELRGLRFADMVDPHDRAKAVKVYRWPLVERRDWALNLRAGKLIGLFIFDCRLVSLGSEQLVVLVGRGVEVANSESIV